MNISNNGVVLNLVPEGDHFKLSIKDGDIELEMKLTVDDTYVMSRYTEDKAQNMRPF